jgi:hypothetical protein
MTYGRAYGFAASNRRARLIRTALVLCVVQLALNKYFGLNNSLTGLVTSSRNG